MRRRRRHRKQIKLRAKLFSEKPELCRKGALPPRRYQSICRDPVTSRGFSSRAPPHCGETARHGTARRGKALALSGGVASAGNRARDKRRLNASPASQEQHTHPRSDKSVHSADEEAPADTSALGYRRELTAAGAFFPAPRRRPRSPCLPRRSYRETCPRPSESVLQEPLSAPVCVCVARSLREPARACESGPNSSASRILLAREPEAPPLHVFVLLFSLGCGLVRAARRLFTTVPTLAQSTEHRRNTNA